MLRSMKEMEGYAIGATDGVIGEVKDFYFDDESWVVRYLIVETGSWLSHREVLISPVSVGPSNPSDRIFPVSITRQQVLRSPSIDTDLPVSRQHEEDYLSYYGYPFYWGSDSLWGEGLYPNELLSCVARTRSADSPGEPRKDPHLRSGNAVTGYDVHASDGDIGHVQGLLVDAKTWAVRYIVVNTGHWWLGHEVLVAPEWINDIQWSAAKIMVDLTRELIQHSPAYHSDEPLSSDMESGTYQHYGKAGPWPKRSRHVPRDSPMA